jgi:hypothetical protein
MQLRIRAVGLAAAVVTARSKKKKSGGEYPSLNFLYDD